MAPSHAMSKVGKKRGNRPGRRSVRVVVRLEWDQAARLDRWRKGLTGNPKRPEAMRRLIEHALPGSHRATRSARRCTKHQNLLPRQSRALLTNLGRLPNAQGLSDALFMDQGSFATFAPTCQTRKDNRCRRRGDPMKQRDVCFWHKADMPAHSTDVRFWG